MKSGEPKNGLVTVELSNGVLHVRWAQGAVVRESDAKALMTRAAELSLGRALPMLVQMDNMTWIDRGAQEAFATSWPLSGMALVGSSPVDEVLASFYSARRNPACPTRYFTSVEEARIWLAACSQPKEVESSLQPGPWQGTAPTPSSRRQC